MAKHKNKFAKPILVFALVALCLGGLVLYPNYVSKQQALLNNRPTAAPISIVIESTGFRPASLTIRPGQSVVWVNNDSKSRTIHLHDEGQSSDIAVVDIAQGQSYRYTFQKPGVFHVHEQIEPETFHSLISVNP